MLLQGWKISWEKFKVSSKLNQKEKQIKDVTDILFKLKLNSPWNIFLKLNLFLLLRLLFWF